MNANSSLMSSPLCRSHHYCQHHYLLFILLHLITSLILVVTEGVFVATSFPTATITIIKTGPRLLPSGGRTTGSRIGTIHGLDSGLDNRMSSVNYDQPSATQLHIVPSFMVVPSNPLLILLLGKFLPLLGSRTSVWTNMLHLILQLWSILHPILVMIIFMLVMVRALPYHILNIPRYISQNIFLNYLTFFMFLILPNHYCLLKFFVIIIMFILNFTLLCFMSRISSARKFSFPIRVMMVSMSYPSLLSRQSFKRLVSLHLRDCWSVVLSFRSFYFSYFKFGSFQL